jgi:hypothetical protein
LLNRYYVLLFMQRGSKAQGIKDIKRINTE